MNTFDLGNYTKILWESFHNSEITISTVFNYLHLVLIKIEQVYSHVLCKWNNYRKPTKKKRTYMCSWHLFQKISGCAIVNLEFLNHKKNLCMTQQEVFDFFCCCNSKKKRHPGTSFMEVRQQQISKKKSNLVFCF